MSTFEDPKVTEWRTTVQPCLLRHEDFDEALEAACTYHKEHPVEDGVLNGEPAPPPRMRENVFDELHQGTLEKLKREHREALMQCFIKKNVPPEWAGKIVDDLILNEDCCPA